MSGKERLSQAEQDARDGIAPVVHNVETLHYDRGTATVLSMPDVPVGAVGFSVENHMGAGVAQLTRQVIAAPRLRKGGYNTSGDHGFSVVIGSEGDGVGPGFDMVVDCVEDGLSPIDAADLALWGRTVSHYNEAIDQAVKTHPILGNVDFSYPDTANTSIARQFCRSEDMVNFAQTAHNHAKTLMREVFAPDSYLCKHQSDMYNAPQFVVDAVRGTCNQIVMDAVDARSRFFTFGVYYPTANVGVPWLSSVALLGLVQAQKSDEFEKSLSFRAYQMNSIPAVQITLIPRLALHTKQGRSVKVVGQTSFASADTMAHRFESEEMFGLGIDDDKDQGFANEVAIARAHMLRSIEGANTNRVLDAMASVAMQGSDTHTNSLVRALLYAKVNQVYYASHVMPGDNASRNDLIALHGVVDFRQSGTRIGWGLSTDGFVRDTRDLARELDQRNITDTYADRMNMLKEWQIRQLALQCKTGGVPDDIHAVRWEALL